MLLIPFIASVLNAEALFSGESVILEVLKMLVAFCKVMESFVNFVFYYSMSYPKEMGVLLTSVEVSVNNCLIAEGKLLCST